MHLPAAFRRQILATFADEGAAWLARLPELLAEYAGRWALRLGPAFPNLSFNYVAPATRPDGSPAVLKLGVPRDELGTEIDALRSFGEGACVGLLAADEAGGALLIERADPGRPLSDLLPDDDQATAIAARAMRGLWAPPPAGHRFPSVDGWFAGLKRLREHYAGSTGPFPAALVERAEGLYAELRASAPAGLLLHGDLHHFNILSARRSPWLVIDPKGIVGDPAFEPAALLLNPVPSLLDYPLSERILRRRLDILAAELGLDRRRIHAWASAFAILSAWWCVEDGSSNWEHPLTCAGMLVQC